MKLVTKELEEKFKEYPGGSQEGLGLKAKVIVKYFNPIGVGTWLIIEADKQPNGDYILFGYCHLGDDSLAEFGSVSLQELQEVISIERELYLKEDCTMLEAMEQSNIKVPQYLLEKESEMDFEDY